MILNLGKEIKSKLFIEHDLEKKVEIIGNYMNDLQPEYDPVFVFYLNEPLNHSFKLLIGIIVFGLLVLYLQIIN